MTDVIFHCSDSSFGNAALIAKWHLERGWTGIGYHYVILNGHIDKTHFNSFFNGHVETGRPLDSDPFIEGAEVGAHVKGHNKSVGICLIGKSGKFSKKQIMSAVNLISLLTDQFGEIDIHQHSDFDEKKPDCAGLNIEMIMKGMADSV